MKKRAVCFALIGCLLLSLIGCGGNDDFSELTSSLPVPSEIESEPEPPAETHLQNPITGTFTLEEGEQYHRPVAVMVNNVSVAQSVQCGLNDADLIFECLVEGGVTRLMAVFYDIEKAGQVGSIRSARYTYVQLAQGLDALYVHAGSDPVYTRPYMRNIGLDDYDMGRYADGSFRVDNGLAWEHRLFTKGELLTADLTKHAFRTTRENPMEPLFRFADEQTAVTAEDPCTSVTYTMSTYYKTTFVYDETTGHYLRQPNGSQHKDYQTGEATWVDNVFLLYADSPLFDDGLHVQTVLSNGSGLYVSGGKCQPITWYKGSATAPLSVFDLNGDPLTVNPGRSWIAFPRNSNQDETVIQSVS